MWIFGLSLTFKRILLEGRSLEWKCHTHSRNFSFITTPIFYVNSYPHIGHLYSLLLADARNRYQNLKLPSTAPHIFGTGTDEHGQKVERAATSANISPIHHCDKVSNTFRRLCSEFNISNTDFLRTTEARHRKAVNEFWNKLRERGHIYKGKYEGWYSVSDEAFLPAAHSVLEKSGADGKTFNVSAETGYVVEWVREDNFMFNLSSFSDQIRQWIQTENPIQPQLFTRSVLKWLEEDCPNLSVSRPISRLSWGIPVPDDPSHVIYVWLDALVNYLSIAGYGSEPFRWPPTFQVVGKDILKFHAVYWPAFLLAAGLDPPRKILCHSHWTIDNVKMSKSLGNVVDPFQVQSRYGSEALRYFLLREGVPHSDGNYNEEKLRRVVNAELADTLGNLLSRCTAPALNPHQIWPQFQPSSLSKLSSPTAKVLIDSVESLPEKVEKSSEDWNFYRGIEDIMATLRIANLFMEEEKPWLLVKKSTRDEGLLVMTCLILETLRICGTLLLPITPNLATHLLDRINVPSERRKWPYLKPFIWETSCHEMALQPMSSVLFRRIQRNQRVN